MLVWENSPGPHGVYVLCRHVVRRERQGKWNTVCHVMLVNRGLNLALPLYIIKPCFLQLGEGEGNHICLILFIKCIWRTWQRDWQIVRTQKMFLLLFSPFLLLLFLQWVFFFFSVKLLKFKVECVLVLLKCWLSFGYQPCWCFLQQDRWSWLILRCVILKLLKSQGSRGWEHTIL